MAASLWAGPGEMWYAEIVGFRRNPLAYLNSKKLDEESFLHDILLALWDDTVQNIAKIHLLAILEEFTSQLLNTPESIEHAFGALIDIFKQTSAQGATLYRRQILVTVTSLVVVGDIKDYDGALFGQYMEQLLDLVCRTNTSADLYLRTTACHCLHEVESVYPGVLLRKLEYLYQMCQMENSPAIQGYLLLFTTTLANAIGFILQNPDEIPADYLTDLLANRTEPLKPYICPKLLHSYTDTLQLDVSECLSQDIDSHELKRATSFLMDHLYLLTSPALCTVLRCLLDIVSRTPSILPSIFKWAIVRYSHCLDLQLLHFVLDLKDRFKGELFSEQDSVYLLRGVLQYLSNLSIPIAHRLLIYEWLPELNQVQVSPDSHLLCLNEPSQYGIFFPRIYDGVDTQLKKLKLLSLALQPLQDEDVVAGTLLQSVSGLIKPVRYGVSGKVCTILFKALYIFYNMHHQHQALIYRIESLLVELVSVQSRFTPQVLNFINAIQKLDNSGPVIISLLLAMMESMTSDSLAPPTEQDLQHQLIVLKRVAQELSVTPKKVLHPLNELLQKVCHYHHGNWLLGNLLLSVCRTLIQCHNIQPVFLELGEFLHTMSTCYADVDIQDRAKFYYGLLTSIAADKASLLLVQATSSEKDTAGIVSDNANVPKLLQVLSLEDTLISLTRVPRIFDDEVIENGQCVDSSKLLAEYKSHWRSSSKCLYIPMNYTLHLNCDNAGISEVYALILQLTTSNSYFPIDEVQVPYLMQASGDTHNKPDDVSITVQLRPIEPRPTVIQVVGLFMSAEGRMYETQIPDLEIQFQDLCLPLPWPQKYRQELFTLLWQHFTDDEQAGSDHSMAAVESVASLPVTAECVDWIMSTTWNEFIIGKSLEKEDVVHNVAMFLPPSHHLLMKVKTQGQRTVFSMVTDDMNLLPLAGNHIQQLADSSPAALK